MVMVLAPWPRPPVFTLARTARATPNRSMPWWVKKSSSSAARMAWRIFSGKLLYDTTVRFSEPYSPISSPSAEKTCIGSLGL